MQSRASRRAASSVGHNSSVRFRLESSARITSYGALALHALKGIAVSPSHSRLLLLVAKPGISHSRLFLLVASLQTLFLAHTRKPLALEVRADGARHGGLPYRRNLPFGWISSKGL